MFNGDISHDPWNGRILIVRLWTSSWQRIHENPAKRRPKISETTRLRLDPNPHRMEFMRFHEERLDDFTNKREGWTIKNGDITWFNMVWKVLEYPVEACQKVLSLNYFMFILIIFCASQHRGAPEPLLSLSWSMLDILGPDITMTSPQMMGSNGKYSNLSNWA